MKLLIFLSFCFWPITHGTNITDELERVLYVVGGKEAPDGTAPFQCSIQESKIHSCGCSIISEKWILTAAHCVFKRNASALEILVGTNDLKSGGTYYKVDRYVAHERYFLVVNDIAVIRVQGKIEFNSHVQPIALLSDEVPHEADVQLTGWGDLRLGGKHPKRLQIIKLKAKSCRKTTLRFIAHKSHMCTASKFGYGACFGDSGGPLVYKGKLAGVVSFGLPCAWGIVPDVYASVSYFYDWIKNHTD